MVLTVTYFAVRGQLQREFRRAIEDVLFREAGGSLFIERDFRMIHVDRGCGYGKGDWTAPDQTERPGYGSLRYSILDTWFCDSSSR